MFNIKKTISILNNKWEPIKRNIKVNIIPRKDELIYLDNKYFEVIHVIHMLNKEQNVFIIIGELEKQPIISD